MRDRRATGLIEYALVIALVSIVAVASLDTVAKSVRGRFSAVTAAI